MESILIDKIRISGFRGLDNFEMTLSKITVITGVNNVGKTTILKALQLALGSRTFLSSEDFFIEGINRAVEIIIDLRIIPVNEKGVRLDNFSDDWESVFNTNSIQYEDEKKAIVPLRTKIIYDELKGDFKKEQSILYSWENSAEDWRTLASKKIKHKIEVIPFFYIEAQRDVVEDIKQRNSYLGKMLSEVSKSYNPEEIDALERMIEDLNKEAVDKSNILKTIQDALAGVDSTMNHNGSKIDITPFAKKIRDLNKNISIQYGEYNNTFTMDYHGMGTRSWSSLLTFKAFITQNEKISLSDDSLYFPIIAIEEPESHLHPNAQKQLYHQICEMPGQKIVSTHSPYIATCAELLEIRNVYKEGNKSISGIINITDASDIRKIKQKVIHTKGEIFFSRALVLFEGETEEQALPILAEKYFGCYSSLLGIDFVGVGGSGNYYPFLKFAEDLKIPWYLLSDGEEKTKKTVKSVIKKLKGREYDNIKDDNIFFISNDKDFEGMLLDENYISEIKNALIKVKGDKAFLLNYIREKDQTTRKRVKTGSKCSKCNQFIFEDIIRNYSEGENSIEALDDIMESCKTEFGPAIAEEINGSAKGLPRIIKTLFNKIKKDFNI